MLFEKIVDFVEYVFSDNKFGNSISGCSKIHAPRSDFTIRKWWWPSFGLAYLYMTQLGILKVLPEKELSISIYHILQNFQITMSWLIIFCTKHFNYGCLECCCISAVALWGCGNKSRAQKGGPQRTNWANSRTKNNWTGNKSQNLWGANWK